MPFGASILLMKRSSFLRTRTRTRQKNVNQILNLGRVFSLRYLVLVLIKDDLFIKRMLTTWHPYTRATFLCQGLQSDIGKRMHVSPPASPLSKYGRNRVRAGRRTKTQSKRVIRANVCLVRHPCHNLACSCSCSCSYKGSSLHQKDAHPKGIRIPGLHSYVSGYNLTQENACCLRLQPHLYPSMVVTGLGRGDELRHG